MSLAKIFAIIDPTSDNKILINRLGRIIARAEAEDDVCVTAYCCNFSNQPTSDANMLEQVATTRISLWLDTLFADLRESGVNVEYQLEWNPDWRDALPSAVAAADCDLVVKNSYSHRGEAQRLSKQIDRAILRGAKAPVLLLRRDEIAGNGIILAALKAANLDELHERANQSILNYCHLMLRSNPRFDLHVVSCYSGSDNFIYPEDLAEIAGVDRTKAHTIDGSPMKGIESVASELEAEVVFIGSVARKGVTGKLLGNTAEQILDTLNSDIAAFIERE